MPFQLVPGQFRAILSLARCYSPCCRNVIFHFGYLCLTGALVSGRAFAMMTFHHFWRLQGHRFILDILFCTMMVLHSCIAIWPVSFTAFHNVQFRAFTSAYRCPSGGVGSIEVGNPISRMTNNNPAMQKE